MDHSIKLLLCSIVKIKEKYIQAKKQWLRKPAKVKTGLHWHRKI